MKKNLTARQMINIELAIRARNKKSAQVLKHHIPLEEQEQLKIEFNCECSDPDCQKRLSLTLEEYQKLHKNHAHFILFKGHVEPKVEKVEKNLKNLAVVEKYAAT